MSWVGSLATPFAPRPISAPARPADDIFASLSLALPSDTDLPALAAVLAAPGSGVLRAKGLTLDALGQGQLLQVVSGRWSVTPASFTPASFTPASFTPASMTVPGRLVLIGLRGKMPTELPGSHGG